jgi:hypothetical protein
MPLYNVVFSVTYTLETTDEASAEDRGWEILQQELLSAGYSGMVKDFAAIVEELN